MAEDDAPRTLSAWILKRKSTGSARNRILGNVNKRYFTLDFENQILFYSQSESQKTVSLPMPFTEITAVEALAEPEASAPPLAKSNSRFKMPALPKIPSRHAGWTHGLAVHGKTKAMELLFPSEAQASEWQTALRTAMRMGEARKGAGDVDVDVKAEQSTAAGSSVSCDSTPRDMSPRDYVEVLGGGAGANESQNPPQDFPEEPAVRPSSQME